MLGLLFGLQVWLNERKPDVRGEPVSIFEGLQRWKGSVTQAHRWGTGPPCALGFFVLPAPGCSCWAGWANGRFFILFNKMVFGSVGSSVQNLKIIWVRTLCSSTFRQFPRSYHETPPCNIPSEDYYDIYVERETEITKFESLFLCSQAFLMSGNNLHFQIHYPLNFLKTFSQRQMSSIKNMSPSGQKWEKLQALQGRSSYCWGSYHLVFMWCRMPKTLFSWVA